MKRFIKDIIIYAGIALGAFFLVNSCTKQIVPPINKIIYIPTPDTMSIQEVILLKEELRKCQDSLRIIRTDSTMSAELFVAKYKLERIRYYNDIAAKGNNIKYLRGWINRTLK